MNRLISENGEYFAVSAYDAYGSGFSGTERWIVVSDRCPGYLTRRHPDTMRALSPLVFVSSAVWRVFERGSGRNGGAHLQGGPPVQEALARHEEMMDLLFFRELMKALTPLQRRRMREHIFLGKTVKQLAGSEGVSERSVRISLNSAAGKIADLLEGRDQLRSAGADTYVING